MKDCFDSAPLSTFNCTCLRCAKNCAKCHGESGNGYGPVTQGFTTWPRQLWVWHNTGPETDGYIYWFITYGRSDMPPWGVILSDKEKWDLVSYVKTIKPPTSE